MNNIVNLYLSSHALFTTLACSLFFMVLMKSKDDELEQQALNNALKNSIVVSFVLIIGYTFFQLILGNSSVTIHTILLLIDGISILTVLLYYLELKGIYFSFKDFKERTAKILNVILIIPAAIATISLILNLLRKLVKINIPDYLGSSQGIIRYDELLLYSGVILLAISTPLMPKIKKMSRDEYKKRLKKIDKIFGKIYLVYGTFFIVLILYIIYRAVSL